MGQRGPKPLPSNVRAFTGMRRALRAADLSDGVHPEVGLPPIPTWLCAEARKEWKRITPELLALGLMTRLDQAALSLYCQAYGRRQQVERALAGRVSTVQADGKDAAEALLTMMPSGIVRESVLSRMASDLRSQVDRHLAAFGLSPSARSRVTASRNDGQINLPGMEEDKPRGFGSL